MARPKSKTADSTEVVSIRISRKAKYLLDLACRTTNLTIGKYIEEALMDSFANIKTKDGRRNLKSAGDDFWNENEAQRFMYLVDTSIYPDGNAMFTLSPEEEKLKNVLTQFRYKNELVFVHRNRYFKEELVEYCWNEIQEFAETSDKNDDFNGEDELYSKKYREARENLIKKIEEYVA